MILKQKLFINFFIISYDFLGVRISFTLALRYGCVVLRYGLMETRGYC